MDVQNEIYKRRKELSIYWYNKASDLRGSAGALWASMDDAKSTEIAEKLGLENGFSIKIAAYPVYKMLCGMALELIYKAIVVAKGNEPDTQSHKLINLASSAGLKVKDEQIGLLSILSESVIWDGRYPVPKNLKDFKLLSELRDEHLYEKAPLGKLYVLKPNGALCWESFNEIWIDAFEVYWQHHE